MLSYGFESASVNCIIFLYTYKPVFNLIVTYNFAGLAACRT